MSFSSKPPPVTPRIIIHGGAGNITRANLPPEAYAAYRSALLSILHDANTRLQSSSATALEIATQAVVHLENNPLFNCAHGAVFTRSGTHELEASVMVSSGRRKRGVGVMKLSRVKNPILLAKEVLLRGEEEDGGGAFGHVQLEGESCERLAGEWGVERCRGSWFWTKRRWEEHRRGLGLSVGKGEYERRRREADGEGEDEVLGSGEVAGVFDGEAVSSDPSWNGKDYLPQGTVGCVVLDRYGTLCAATSTGGLTNKLPGRIGDTPTLGAGFWAEEWHAAAPIPSPLYNVPPALSSLASAISSCLPSLTGYTQLTHPKEPQSTRPAKRAVAMSGTGNGDSFLRLSAVRTAAAIARFSSSPRVSLQDAVTAVAGLNGMLQQSAEDRWHKTGEGEGGIIGIEYDEGSGEGRVVADFNCGGMFRAWVDDGGKVRFRVLREEY